MTTRSPIGSTVAYVRGAVFVSILVSTGAADAAGPPRPFQFGSWSLKKLALADLAGGMSARKVGERYGLSHQTVNNWRNADKAERG